MGYAHFLSHSPHGDEYALLVQATWVSCINTRLCSFYEEFHAAINAISPPAMTAEEEASRKEAVEQDLVKRGRKQMETALNVAAVPKEERDRILSKYGTEWTLKKLNIRIGVSTGLYVPGINGREKNWAKHADEALKKAKGRDGKNGIVVYYEGSGVLSAANGSSQCLKPHVSGFNKKQKQ